MGGNPTHHNLAEWLGLINNWLNANENHVPITVFIELKDDITDDDNIPWNERGIVKLDQTIKKNYLSNNSISKY